MPLGYCMKCEQLKPIVKLGQKWGSRECEWAPIHHNRPDRHVRVVDEKFVECGTVEWSEINNEDYTGPQWVATCSQCGVVPEREVVPTDDECPGSRKPIR